MKSKYQAVIDNARVWNDSFSVEELVRSVKELEAALAKAEAERDVLRKIVSEYEKLAPDVHWNLIKAKARGER